MADSVTDAQRIGIVLADDHAMIRGGLRRVLDAETDLRVVAEAGNVEEALRLTRKHQPRIVVLDLNMPGPSTLDAIPEFLDAATRCAVLVLTMEGSPRLAQAALGAGAAGYVLKEAAETELVEAVRSLLAGPTYLDPAPRRQARERADRGSCRTRTRLPMNRISGIASGADRGDAGRPKAAEDDWQTVADQAGRDLNP